MSKTEPLLGVRYVDDLLGIHGPGSVKACGTTNGHIKR